MIRKIVNVSQAMLKCLAASALIAMTVPATAAIVVHTSDFISNENRTGFNGFEEMASDWLEPTDTHTEGGIRIDHVGKPVQIWTIMHLTRIGFEGERAWYPNLVDPTEPWETGYERIVLSSGADFDSVGLLVGSGFGGYCYLDCDAVAPFLSLHYELFNDGLSVASGVLGHHPHAHYVGFSGGGFDEVRVWDSALNSWPGQSALLIDSIEVARAVPEPATALLLLAGLGGLVQQRRNVRKQQEQP